MAFERPIYPTNGFRFLNNPDFPSYPVQPSKLQHRYHTDRQPESISSPAWIQPVTTAKLPLQINIVGAGLCGLATAITLTLSGHQVKLFESAPAFGEVGAGIQVPPNSTRCLLAWGVGPHIEPHISEPEGIRIRRWQTGELIGITPLRSHGPSLPIDANDHSNGHGTSNGDSAGSDILGFREKFGAPYFVVHRADYHGALVARCRELNIDIREGCQVVEYEVDDTSDTSTTKASESSKISLVLKNGERHAADLIIAADGLKSPARMAILRSHNLKPVVPHSTSQAAYRATVPLSQLQADPATAWITATPNQNMWIGPSRHAMTYSIGGLSNPNRIFNLVLSHPESNPPEQWSTEPAQVREEMKGNFAGWDTRLLGVLDRVSQSPQGRVVKWPITTIPQLQTWVHASKRLIIMGDAAHAMVPYVSQGAAIAVEDAAAISAVLGLIDSEDEIGDALDCFETVRMPRASGMQQAGVLNGEIWHLSDGELQRVRDEAMGRNIYPVQNIIVNGTGDGERRDWSPNQWSDPVCQAWIYGYDAVEEVTGAWQEWKKRKGLNK